MDGRFGSSPALGGWVVFSGGAGSTVRGENRERGECWGSASLSLHTKAQLRGKLEALRAGCGPPPPPTHASFRGWYLRRGQQPR